MTIYTRCLISLLLVALLAAPSRAQTVAPVPAAPGGATSDELAPKFIWGSLLLNLVFKLAMSAFTEWLSGRVSHAADLRKNSTMQQLVLNSAGSMAVSLASMALGIKSVGAEENVVAGKETKPLEVNGGRENYQGVHVAIAGFDRAGNFTDLQPVTAGFRSGDRIKLKLLPTFEGLLVVENINARGTRRQIYPPSPDQAILLKAGVEVLIPPAANQFFEFTGVTGDEQLVITVRDPRAVGAAESREQVSRKDDPHGSSFVQETPSGMYPVISQSLRLRHGS